MAPKSMIIGSQMPCGVPLLKTVFVFSTIDIKNNVYMASEIGFGESSV